MGSTKGKKIRLLYLIDILREETDEENPLSAEEIIKKLFEKGQEVERKALYDDISILREYGLDIIQTRSPKAGYFLGEREFETAEIALLCDAAASAGFISKKKTFELIKKLERMLPKTAATSVRRHVYIDNRNKCANEEIFYSIDAARRAIEHGRMLSLKYCRRRFEGNKIEDSVKEMTVSPYALVWSDDHYYLICNNPRYDNLMHLRVDRMRKAKVQKEPARDFSEVSEYKNYFDVADYAQKSFHMYGGERKLLSLRCERELIEQMLDRFGDDVSVKSLDERSFTFSSPALISDGLIDWIMQFGGRVEVLSPSDFRNQVADRAREIAAVYDK